MTAVEHPDVEAIGQHLAAWRLPSASGKTSVWRFYNVQSFEGMLPGQWPPHLGIISWYAPWRRYALQEVAAGAVFDAACLADLAEFCDRKTRQHVEARLSKRGSPEP